MKQGIRYDSVVLHMMPCSYSDIHKVLPSQSVLFEESIDEEFTASVF